MKPYFSDNGIKIFHGDCRDVLPKLNDKFDCIITDPVWPNLPQKEREAWNINEEPIDLLKSAAVFFPALSETLVVILGCNSDPRFLSAIPKELSFIRHSFIEYRIPSPCARILKGHDCVYSFGKIPKKMPGHLLPGRYMEKSNEKKFRGHPTPRNLQLMKWVVKWYAGNSILDPFNGGGTSLLAAKIMGVERAVGIEKNERYCEIAAKRILNSKNLFD